MPKIKWPNKPTKTTMNSFYRFGLLSTKRPHNGRNWLCLACRQEFIEHQNALIHLSLIHI